MANIKKKRSSRPTGFKLLALIFGVLLLGVIAFFVTQHFLQTKDTIPASIPKETKKPALQNGTLDKQNNSSSTQQTSNKGGTDTKSGTTSSATLLAPSGSFVSNHHPSLSSANGVPSSEASVCNTTPGATCEISFTKDSTVKTLKSQTADPSGSVYWNWDVKSAGLSEGSWQITANATLNGKTLSSSDSMNLEISP